MSNAACFVTPLRAEKLGARRWMLIDDLVFRSRVFRGLFVAPRGFQTDFASIPRLAWLLFPPMDVYDAAAVIHDAAYGNALLTAHGDRVFLIKRFGDDLFNECLDVLKVEGWRRRLMVHFVRRYGNPAGHPLAAHAVGRPLERLSHEHGA